ncbi:MAG: hypothetical protein DYG98_02675 [Haliscomenobacteraceae bacterium CHB4]|nr:hypothetical protein [Saprospiraceae bacterium]MCE7921933.1 hypothetical protein [Haliscomenobacteraceae bacterium CHB4]
MQKIIFALAVFGFVTWFACQKAAFNRPVQYIAFVGFNFQDTVKAKRNNYSDSLHILALEDYLRRINAVTKPTRYPAEYRLKVFQCDFKPDTMQAIYRSIAADSSIVLVVDNTWGRYFRRVDSLVRDRLPVISLTADFNSLDFGNNAIFLEPNDPQPFYLVNFIQKVIKAPSVGLITENDYLLHQQFEKVFRQYKLPCDTLLKLRQRALVSNQVPPQDTPGVILQIRRALASTNQELILLNLHSAYGNLVVRALQEARRGEIRPKTIIGISGAINLKDPELQALTKEKGHTILRYETVEEVLPEEVYHLKERIEKQFPKKFFRVRTADNSLLRCYDAMNIFETALRADKTQRGALVRYFQKLIDRKVTIFNELYEFDSTLILKREPTFNRIQSGRTRSYPTQVNTAGEPIPNLHVGIDIVDINDVDIRKNTFNCNLLYWVIVDSRYIEKEGYIDFATLNSPESRNKVAEERDTSNNVLRLYRISGQFLGDFNSFDFPFDRHEIRIPIEALSSSNNIKISFDYSRLQLKNKIADFQMNDWNTEAYYVTLDNNVSNALGSPDKVTLDSRDSAQYLEKYKTLNVHLRVSREPWGAIILIVLPFLMFSALPIFILFFYKASFEEVGELIITSFLATVAYSINLVQISPATDSMNLAYIFLMMTLGINFFCFIYVTYIDRKKTGSRTVASGGKRSIFRLSGKFWLPYLLLILLLMVFYLVFKQ